LSAKVVVNASIVPALDQRSSAGPGNLMSDKLEFVICPPDCFIGQQRQTEVCRTFDPQPCYSLESMLVDTRVYFKLAQIVFGALCLLSAGQIVGACPRPLAIAVDQSATAVNTNCDSSQTDGAKLPTHGPPRSNVPHSVEVASAPTLKQVSWTAPLVDQLAAEIVQAFSHYKPTGQRAGNLWAPSSYSSVIVTDSSGRAPPRQS
jgi:hypothetical protein